MQHKIRHNETAVILDYTENNPGMNPLTTGCPLPMLPVGNKPLIQHQLEWLSDAGFQHMHIALAEPQKGSWLAFLKSFRFGAKLSHSVHSGLCHFDQCRRIFLSQHTGVLWVNGHHLSRVHLPDQVSKSSLFIKAGAYVPMLYLKKRDLFLMMPQLSRLEHMSWMNLVGEVHPNLALAVVQGFTASLKNPRDYRRLVQMTLAQQVPLRMRHRAQAPKFVAAGKVHLGADVQISAHNILGGHVAIGAHSSIKNCLIGDGAFIDENVSLSRCIVTANTYIGNGIQLKDKFICDDFIFDFDTNTGRFIQDKRFCTSKHKVTHPLVALISRLLLKTQTSA